MGMAIKNNNNPLVFCLILLVFLSSFPLISASTFLSGAIFEDHSATGRSILQAKHSCPINFESQNYSIITSQCKGPQYPPKQCCEGFKTFACPFTDELNDLTNDCASTMFSYINLYGKYPPGLFANECREGKEGLACQATSPSSQSANASGGVTANHPTSLSVVLGGALLFWFV